MVNIQFYLYLIVFMSFNLYSFDSLYIKILIKYFKGYLSNYIIKPWIIIYGILTIIIYGTLTNNKFVKNYYFLSLKKFDFCTHLI